MYPKQLSSPLLRYIATLENSEEDPDRIPSLGELSEKLGISVAKLREQLEVARALGVVDVRPRTGIRRKPYSFSPAVRQSLLYAVALAWENFEAFSELRNRVEAAFWVQAAVQLTPEDHNQLQSLMDKAWENLKGYPIKIPHIEHRQLHLTIFKRLANPFVQGILEAYWDAYEAAGLNLYTDYGYQEEVWGYHQRMVDAVQQGDYEAGRIAFVEHTELLYHRPGVDLAKEDTASTPVRLPTS